MYGSYGSYGSYGGNTMIDKALLSILACPACDDRPPVKLEGEKLVCEKCKRAYPIRDGRPIMLIEEAVICND